MADKIKFNIPGKPAYLTMVRLAIGSIADTMGFDFEEIEDIKTAVSEACKNISCHGLDGFAEEYSVECAADEGYLEICVADNSDGHLPGVVPNRVRRTGSTTASVRIICIP